MIEKKGLRTNDEPGKYGIDNGSVAEYRIQPFYDQSVEIIVFRMQHRGHRMEEEGEF